MDEGKFKVHWLVHQRGVNSNREEANFSVAYEAI